MSRMPIEQKADDEAIKIHIDVLSGNVSYKPKDRIIITEQRYDDSIRNCLIELQQWRERYSKLDQDTGSGCSVCGLTPAVNIEGTYWLCGPCVKSSGDQ